MALQDLRTAVAASDLGSALRHLRAVAPEWRSLHGDTPSTAPDALIQRLVHLATDHSMVSTLLSELCTCGLLTARTVETLLAEPSQRSSAANVRKIVELARKQGVEPTCPMQCALLKSLGFAGQLREALDVYEACEEKPTCLRNTILDVCVSCGDIRAAEGVFAAAQAEGLADVITFNTIIKAYLKSGNIRRARAAMEAMRAGGLQPNVVTFNELIDATIKGNPEEIWNLISEMKECGAQPNQVTCSILLKNIQASSRAVDIERTLAILEGMRDRMDEVLLSSACEACIRAGRADLLKHLLRQQRSQAGVRIHGAHTMGSIIRAFGFIGDMAGVRSTWQEMRARNIRPTSITTGCMVEALVTNEGPEAGYRLVRQLLADDATRPFINSVIYNSVLKGFVQQKMYDRVWVVYSEMQEERMQLSVVTYNTLVDACAKSCGMHRIPSLMEEMSRFQIEPNVVTYSTILKGYVQEGCLDKAFQLMDEMKLTREFRPDEIAYNTLLDGCARRGSYDRGLDLLADMQDAGVRPSNYTLSVLVKLANRSHRVEEAFQLCDELSCKYRLRLNIHVYNNLMQACATHQDHHRALSVLEKAVKERVRPDVRTYSIMLRSCISACDAQGAAGLVAAAFGLRCVRPPVADMAALQVRGGLPGDLASEIIAGIAGTCGSEELAARLIKDLRATPRVKLDSKVLVRLASRVPS